jgi:hypothetical protein
LWRWLSADALCPWRHRSWSFPRDSDFATKAGRILDLYDRVWQGRPLHARELEFCLEYRDFEQEQKMREQTITV